MNVGMSSLPSMQCGRVSGVSHALRVSSIGIGLGGRGCGPSSSLHLLYGGCLSSPMMLGQWGSGLTAMREARRFWSKPKKRPKVGTGFHEKAQKWRDEFLLDRHRVLADSLRAYVEFSSTRRAEPWDTRFAPFDRVDKDGVYVITKYLMDEKLQLCHYHHRPVKRLCCNVGLMGPQITTTARWKPSRFATNPANATRADRIFLRDKNVQTGGHHD